MGGGSGGRSAGFLTPDSELELHQLVRRYGPKAAREIWDAPLRGIERLVNGIKNFDIQCGLAEQDSLFLGLGKSGKEAVEEEMECRKSVGFTDQQTYDEQSLKTIIGSEGYSAGIRYGGTYGINPLLCLQAKIIGKPLVFSLTNAWAKFYQVDSHRKTEEMRAEF